MVNVVGGQKRQAGDHGHQPLALGAVDRIADRARRHQRAQEAEQPPVPVGRAKQPDKRHSQEVKERRVVGGIERVDLGVLVRPAEPAEQDRVHQLKALALVVVKRELEDVGGIDHVDDEVEEHGHQGDQQQRPRDPARWGWRRCRWGDRPRRRHRLAAEGDQCQAHHGHNAAHQQGQALRRPEPGLAIRRQQIDAEAVQQIGGRIQRQQPDHRHEANKQHDPA